jgi:hypothetical protein
MGALPQNSARKSACHEHYEAADASLLLLKAFAGLPRNTNKKPESNSAQRSLSAKPLLRLLPRFLTTRAAVQTPPAPVEAIAPPMRAVDGAAVHAWLVDSLARLNAPDAPRSITFAADHPPPQGADDQTITLQSEKGKKLLLVKGQNVDFLNLGGIVDPNLTIVIHECEVNFISLIGSQLDRITIADVAPRGDWPGVVIWAFNLKAGAIFIRSLGNSKFNNHYVTIDAPGLRADDFTIWDVKFVGAEFLEAARQEDQNVEIGFELFRIFSRSLVLSEAHLNTFLAFRGFFRGGLVTLRHASIATRVKFEQCLLKGIHVRRSPAQNRRERNSQREQIVYDEHDLDDTPALSGLVLDLSRAKLGGELVFRDIDEDSTGWMNWSHATTDLLNDDTTLWNGVQISERDKPVRMRFRLNGFEYKALATRGVGPENRLPPLRDPETKPDAAASIPGEQSPHDRPLASVEKEERPGPKDHWSERAAWLRCQVEPDLTYQFMAQPWTAAAHAFRVQGDYHQANNLLHEREKRWHNSLRHKYAKNGGFFRFIPLWVFHWIFSRLPGFGYKLWRPIAVFFVAWLLFAFAYSVQYSQGYFMRNPEASTARNPEVTWLLDDNLSKAFASVSIVPPAQANGKKQCTILPERPKCPELVAAAPVGPTNPEQTADKPNPAAPADKKTPADTTMADYPRFSALVYSFDVMLPLVDFSQGNYWIPGYRTKKAMELDKAGAIGLDLAWYTYWTQILLGWYLTIVTGFAATGLFERRQGA